MSWKETDRMSERAKFIFDLESGIYSISELCRYYGISRPTAYKWINRYEQGGVKALEDLSHARHHHPNETPQEMIATNQDKKQADGPTKLTTPAKNYHASNKAKNTRR